MLRATLPLVALAILILTAPGSAAQDTSLVHITSEVTYDLRAEDGNVDVLWRLTVRNNDPDTSAEGGEDGSLLFYNNIAIPVLRGAQSVEALDAQGEELAVSIDESSTAAILSAAIEFAAPLFYQETYEIGVEYELAGTRERSILVTPAYVFLPIVASGNEATVTIITPDNSDWVSTIEAEDCEQDGNTFRCSGSEGAYIAATAEVSRPAAVSTLPLEVGLQSQSVAVNVTYFQGEESAANHLRELIPAALPVIEDLFGFAYDGPPVINISQGGREAVLGYEGITQCLQERCEIAISPVADDITVIHELTHLWTGIYAKRWLSEGFAQLMAEETAGRLPADLVQTRPPPRSPPAVDLPLDQWGDVESIIGAAEEQLAIEAAGYELSLRFVEALRFEVGNSVLRDVNIAIAEAGTPADSHAYMDLVEDTSGRNLDQLFLTWIFPREYEPIIELRREARDRFAELETRVLLEGLPEGATTGIREDILEWRFSSALSRLDSVESDIETYHDFGDQLGQMASEASSIGLTMPVSISEALERWEFGNVRLALADARDAVDAFRAARAKVHSSRSLWERFGLLGSDPQEVLDRASDEFAAGQFQTSIDSSRAAAEMIDNASTIALRRILIVSGIFAAFGLIILAAVWASHLREREFADQ